MKLFLHKADSKLSKFHQRVHTKKLKRKSKTYGSTPKYADETNGNNKYIHAPEKTTAFETNASDFQKTMHFIKDIETYIGEQDCIIDFSNTVYFSAGAMLLVFSSLQLTLRKNKDKNFNTSIKMSNTPFINRAIKRIQLDKICTQNGEASLDFSAKKRLPLVYGCDVEYSDEIVDFIKKWIYKDEMDATTEFRISDAITETLNNVSVHAYPDRDISEKNWWLMCDVIDDQLYLAIYDRGVGIPNTVVEKKWFWSSCRKTYPEIHEEMEKLIPEGSSIKF